MKRLMVLVVVLSLLISATIVVSAKKPINVGGTVYLATSPINVGGTFEGTSPINVGGTFESTFSPINVGGT